MMSELAAVDPTGDVGAPPSSKRWLLLATVAVCLAAFAFAPTRWVAGTLAALMAMIAVHEWGHLRAARSVGLAAPEFSVGLGPVLWRRSPDRHGTSYVVRMLPFGGFVKLAGMDGAVGEGTPESSTWGGLSAMHKIRVAVAGPFANIVLAWLCVLVVLAAGGVTTATTEVSPVSGSPAALAGVSDGDRVVSVNGVAVDSAQEISDAVSAAAAASAPVVLEVDRAGEMVVVSVMPESGLIGVQFATVTEKLSGLEALQASVTGTARLGWATAQSMTSLASALVSLPAQFAGTGDDTNRVLSPVGASRIASDAASDQGMLGVLALAAVVSMFLAVFNLLPIPPLDGGHVMVTVVEAVGSKVAGREVSVPAEAIGRAAVAMVAMVVMLGLSALVLDIFRPV